jgi:hypothetical protein
MNADNDRNVAKNLVSRGIGKKTKWVIIGFQYLMLKIYEC